MRAFVELREALAAHEELAKRLDELESRPKRKLATHDQVITGILEVIRQLMAPPPPAKRRRIGFMQAHCITRTGRAFPRATCRQMKSPRANRWRSP